MASLRPPIFNPGERLGRPDYPGFWGQPKMEVMVRIDGSHDHKGWNWVRGHFLAMDKGTVRGNDPEPRYSMWK